MMLKRGLALLTLAVCLTVASAAGAEKVRTKWAHAYRYGNREEPRVAITVDDWMYPETWLPQFLEVAEEYNVKLSLYPSGYNLKVEDREIWQAALDAGHVIGCHFFQHKRLTQQSQPQVEKDLKKFSDALDATLGYHYEFLSVRPPFGAGMEHGGGGMVGRWLHQLGFDHIVLWDMDNTDSLDYALKNVKNGSIVLMHANSADLKFFRKLMEGLKDRNYEYVTVNELLNITDRMLYVEQ